jgi:hypothetical protein
VHEEKCTNRGKVHEQTQFVNEPKTLFRKDLRSIMPGARSAETNPFSGTEGHFQTKPIMELGNRDPAMGRRFSRPGSPVPRKTHERTQFSYETKAFYNNELWSILPGSLGAETNPFSGTEGHFQTKPITEQGNGDPAMGHRFPGPRSLVPQLPRHLGADSQAGIEFRGIRRLTKPGRRTNYGSAKSSRSHVTTRPRGRRTIRRPQVRQGST